MAAILVNEVRTTDIVCRYAGEEFAPIFPQTPLNLAVPGPHRLRKHISNEAITVDGGEIRLTVSMGASVYMKFSVLDFNDFVASADKHLYEAKQSGRNCICHIDYSDLRSATEVGGAERAMLFNGEQPPLHQWPSLNSALLLATSTPR
ncbi:MAG: GGDEF domain-containing protein, partial [Gammaproteobacteria bacterium]|nr:GGDEF domain-containing protein [Gammaproteobacteria bacterium]